MSARVVEDLATTYAVELLHKHGLDGYVILWHDKGVMAGRCNFQSKIITLNRALLLDTAARNIEETIKHEIAHALVEPNGEHNKEWFDKLVSIGGTGVWVFNDGTTKTVDLTEN